MNCRSVLSLTDLTIRYATTVAVDALSLEIHAGEIYGLLGPNGSGKSSTLSAAAGILTTHSGTVRIAGLRLDENARQCRRLLGLVPQELAFYEELSPAQNLAFFGRLYGLSGTLLRECVDEVLAEVDLTHQSRRPACTLSGGEQRRLNLGCALLHEPLILLLDEPTHGLDVRCRESLFALLRRLGDRGCGIVFTTHHLEEAESLCDRVGIMSHGRLVAEGPVEELTASPADPEPAARPLESLFLTLTGGSRTAA
jgi:ABC-2 type transport system ATP-binding protein